MDQRSTADPAPTARVQSWARIAARLQASTEIPAQRAQLAA